MRNSIPKLRKKISKYKGRETIYASVRLNGKDFILGVYGTADAQARYESIVGEWLANSRKIPDSLLRNKTRNQSSAIRNDATLTEICIDFVLAKQALKISHEELQSIKRVLRELRAKNTNLLASNFTETEFIAFRDHLVSNGITPKSDSKTASEKPTKRKLSRSVVNKYCAHVVRMVKHAAKTTRKVPTSVFQAINAVEPLRSGETVAHETGAIPLVKETVIDAAIEFLHPIVADMVRLQLLTGMRPGEVCLLKMEDVDQSGDVWVFSPPKHKTAHRGIERKIFIGSSAQEILSRYQHRAANQFCFSAKDRFVQDGKPPIIAGKEVGDSYNTRSYRQAIWRACDKAEIPRWSPNRIRKTAATNVRKEGGLEAAQAILGHKSRSTTERFYADIDNSQAIDVMSRIG